MRVRFDGYVFDMERRELSRGTDAVHLAPKAFQLLHVLLENHPRAVSQQELYDRLWPQTYVEPANLHKLIYQVREALDDRDHSKVKTVYGFGFAFTAAMTADAGASPVRWHLLIGDREFDLHDGENVIGRDRDAAVRIEESSISRHHARIVISAAAAVLEDLGSKNGTTVAGRRIHHVRLDGGEKILFGTVAASVWRHSGEPSTETVP